MKNVISKTTYVLMALIMLVTLSCSPEDGEDGAQGSTGQDGTNGQDGEDGNANVQTFTFDISAESGIFIDLNMVELTQTVVDNDAILYYVSTGGPFYGVPGGGPFADYLVRVFTDVGFGRLIFNNYDGSTYSLSVGELDVAKVVIIESTNKSAGTSGNESIYINLKAAGVNVNNYYQVMDYYGLDY